MNAPLLELKDAAVMLDGYTILQNLNWSLEAGEHCAIIGENGSGKSTFLRLIGGLIWPQISRSRIYGFGDAPTFTPLLAREKIAHLSPEIQENYVRRSQDGADNEKGWDLNVETTVLTGYFDSWLLNQQPSETQIVHARELLERFSLADLSDRHLLSLSQGQLRRVLLARSIVKSPEVLLLDESCSGLDKKSRHAWLQALETLAQSGETTLVVTTHRREEIVPSIHHRYRLKNHTLHAIKSHEATVSHTPVEVKTRRKSEAKSETPLIRIDDAVISIDGTPIIENFSWQWHHGQHFRVTGENGSGKSTFFRLLRGQLRPAWGGKIVRFGQDKELPLQEIGAQASLLSPQLQARFADKMNVVEAISTGFFDAFIMHRPLIETEKARVSELISQLEIEHLRERTFGKLSYGQTRRVLLARALVTKPKIVLLDEALDGLDVQTRQWMFDFLEKQVENGVHFAVSSHHDEDFPAFLNAEIHFENGKISGVGVS